MPHTMDPSMAKTVATERNRSLSEVVQKLEELREKDEQSQCQIEELRSRLEKREKEVEELKAQVETARLERESLVETSGRRGTLLVNALTALKHQHDLRQRTNVHCYRRFSAEVLVND